MSIDDSIRVNGSGTGNSVEMHYGYLEVDPAVALGSIYKTLEGNREIFRSRTHFENQLCLPRQWMRTRHTPC
jgi:hypothetical protein